MLLVQGISKFTIVDISTEDFNNIFDAFQQAREGFIHILNVEEKQLAKAYGISVKEVPKLREAMQKKIDFYENHQKKMMKYAKKG